MRYARDGCGNACHHFGGTVCTGKQHRARLKLCLPKPQRRGVSLAEKPEKREQPADAEHCADTADNLQKRDDEIDRGKCRFADDIGDKIAVHHTVNGNKNHHKNGRQRKADQFSIGKMIRQLNFDGVTSKLFSNSARKARFIFSPSAI